MAIITVSRQLGSFGDEITQKVANSLNYEYVDKSKIGEALVIQGFPILEVEKYDEKKPSIWDSFSNQRRRFLHLIQAVIYDFAEKDKTVIVGRGGQIVLKDVPGALHVRIVAPFNVRLKRIMEREGHDERNGEKILRRSDRDSAGYIRSFFGADWDNQTLYDMVINTHTISTDTGVKMIINTIDSPEFKESSKEALEKLADLALLQKVEARLIEIPGVNIQASSVEKGVVTLIGTANSDGVKEGCEGAISSLKGVNRVNAEIRVIPTVGP